MNAKRIYKLMAELGLNPQPWQLQLLKQMEQHQPGTKFAIKSAGRPTNTRALAMSTILRSLEAAENASFPLVAPGPEILGNLYRHQEA